jgi:hypothetical protein
MSISWDKLGLIFCPDGEYPWMQSHAANPVAEFRHDDVFRIYFGSRDTKNRSHIGYVDIDLNRPKEILSISPEPVIGPGKLGAFDDSGTSMGCLVHHEGRRYLYYLGWNLGVTVPWRNSIGLAVSAGMDEPFLRVSPAPIMDRNSVDPYTISYPWVLAGKDKWRMWYGSHLSWSETIPGGMKHLLKYAESEDGINWKREGVVALSFKSEDEYAIARPSVLQKSTGYLMWYTYRGDRYRIGHAESGDGKSWNRKDRESVIDLSSTGWDSEMIDYPCVFEHKGRYFMLYSGNGYGRTGFGMAVSR